MTILSELCRDKLRAVREVSASDLQRASKKLWTKPSNHFVRGSQLLESHISVESYIGKSQHWGHHNCHAAFIFVPKAQINLQWQ